MIHVPPRIILDGDKAAAVYYTRFGQKILSELRLDLSRMYDEPLMTGSVTKELPGGGFVTAKIRGNNSQVEIFMPYGADEEEKEAKEEETENYYIVFVMGNWTGGASFAEPEPDDAATFIWDVNKNNFAPFIDPDDPADDPQTLTYPCEYRKVREFVEGDGHNPGKEVSYDGGLPNEDAQIFQAECYRLWVGYGKTNGDMQEMHPPAVTLPPGCTSELGYCYPDGGPPCLIGYHHSCQSDVEPNYYPFNYACAGVVNDFASSLRIVDYDGYSGSACQGTGIAGMPYHNITHNYVHAVLPTPNPGSFGAEIVFEQSHTGLINTNNGRGNTVCLRVDRDNYGDDIEIVDIAGTYNANPAGCKLYYLNEHNKTADSGTKRSIVLPLFGGSGLIRLRNEGHLNQVFDEMVYYGTTATGITPDGNNMFGEAATSSSRHTRRYAQDGDNLSAPYCVPRDGVYKNVMYQFYCSWGTVIDIWEYGEGSSYDGHPAVWYPAGTTYTKDIKVAACCSMFGVQDPDGPYAHLANENPKATEHNPTIQERSADLESALMLWLTGERGVVYNKEQETWSEYDLASPRPADEGLSGKIYHHFCKTTKTIEEVEVIA